MSTNDKLREALNLLDQVGTDGAVSDRNIDSAIAILEALAASKPEQEVCRFPDCKCPMDPGPEPDWCAKGLPHASKPEPQAQPWSNADSGVYGPEYQNQEPQAKAACCGHASDCAVHNEPAYPAGPCDCGFETQAQAAEPNLVDRVLATLDALRDDAAVHIYPDDLEKCSRSECAVTVYSVRVGDISGARSVPLFSREQVAAAITQAQGAKS